MKAAADCSRAGSHDVDQRARGSTGVRHSQQPFCHLEGMLGWGAVMGLRQGSWKPCASAVSWVFLEPPQHCFILFPGSPTHTHAPTYLVCHASAWQDTLFRASIPLSPPAWGLHYRSLLSPYPSHEVKEVPFFRYFFFLVFSFWKKLCRLIHISSICVIQAILSWTKAVQSSSVRTELFLD